MSETSKPISQIMVLGWLVAILQAAMLGAGAWNIRETISNGQELVGIKKEIALRVEAANGFNAQHPTFATHEEVDAKISILKDSISQLIIAMKENTESVHALREEQIRLRGMHTKEP